MKAAFLFKFNNLFKRKIYQLFGFFLMLISLVGLDFCTKVYFQKKYLVTYSLFDIKNYVSNTDSVYRLVSGNQFIDLSFTYVRNTGAAWGLLGSMNEAIRPYFFYSLTIVAITIMLVYFFKTHATQYWLRLGLCLIISGAFGNFIDRFYLHYVIDWIHIKWSFSWWTYDYPVFNVADSCVTIGVIILLIDSVVQSFSSPKQQQISKKQK